LTHFPRWVAVSFVLIIGLILYVGVFADSSGGITIPGTGSIIYVAAVIAIAALLAYVDRQRDASGKDPGTTTGDKDRHGGVAG
jgi:hypothetical protein